MSEWQPIETAPRNGTAVILLIDDIALQGEWIEYPANDRRGKGEWKVEQISWHGCECCEVDDDQVTHWMPLPPPPSAD